MNINIIILIIIFILHIVGLPLCFFLVGLRLTQFNRECEETKIRALDTFNKNKGKITKQIDNQIKELGGKKQMQIDEFEFRDKNGNEIEPTKNQLVIYIKSLRKQIKDLKETQKQLVIKELENLKKEFESRKLEYISHLTKKHCYGLRIDRLSEIIDDKIKELTETTTEEL